jgi:hypothetical protein
VSDPSSPDGTSPALRRRLPQLPRDEAGWHAFVRQCSGDSEAGLPDRLTQRHFKELTLAETAQVLGIGAAAAAKHYVRALKRLKDILTALPGGAEGP